MEAPALRSPSLPALAQELRAWTARRPGAVAMAGLLAFAAPLKFFIGFLGLVQQPEPAVVTEIGLWWCLYAAILWGALLAGGHLGERLTQGAGRLRRTCTWAALALACAAAASLATAGRASVLIELGVVQGALPMQLYATLLSSTLAMLFFAHLDRARLHERAVARLAAAQAAQREARRRFVQVDLQAVQARIDPGLLFDMLDAVKDAYAADAARAEHLLDELIAFLRASLPRIRSHASSVAREVELARAYVRLLALAQCRDRHMRLEVSHEALHARFAPGALLPLVDSALRARGGDCSLQASCVQRCCQLTLRLPAPPSPEALARVQALLLETDGPAAAVSADCADYSCVVTIRVPHEPA